MTPCCWVQWAISNFRGLIPHPAGLGISVYVLYNVEINLNNCNQTPFAIFQEFFSAELESDNPKTTKKLCLYALKTIYIYATHFEKLPPAEIAGVSKAVEACCRFIQTNSKTETDSQTAEKSLYHVLNNALKKVCTSNLRYFFCF